MNDSERLVAALSEKTFLSLWSYPNPIRSDNKKELCDLLVICNPYIFIISVKEISIAETGSYEIESDRWDRKAIEKSYKQIYGAERALCDGVEIASHDGSEILDLPKLDEKHVFRIAIALGRGERFPLRFGDFGSGFVDVLDEISLNVLLTELDTITDFVTYLKMKETFFERGGRIITDGEENLLAIYLHQGRQFPTNYDELHIDSSTWEEFTKKDEYIRKKEEDKQSYI